MDPQCVKCYWNCLIYRDPSEIDTVIDKCQISTRDHDRALKIMYRRLPFYYKFMYLLNKDETGTRRQRFRL